MNVADLVPDISTLSERLAAVGYLADPTLATALFCAVRLPQPLLLEGEAAAAEGAPDITVMSSEDLRDLFTLRLDTLSDTCGMIRRF